MMHLDTNTAIAVLNDRPHSVRMRFEEAREEGAELAISIVVYHELMYGAATSERRLQNEEKIALFIASGRVALLPFAEEDTREAAGIRAHLKRLGTPIGPCDVFIAAQARRQGAALVTANGREFARVPRLMVIDWAA